NRTFLSLAYHDQDFQESLKQYSTIVIDEVSMVSNDLPTFISNMFERIHNSHQPFGGKNVIVVGDLGQLPPVQGSQVFFSPVWQLFYPIFLTTSHRQGDDRIFFDILQKIRIGQIDHEAWDALHRKCIIDSQQLRDILSSTHITGLRATANDINNTICAHL